MRLEVAISISEVFETSAMLRRAGIGEEIFYNLRIHRAHRVYSSRTNAAGEIRGHLRDQLTL